MELLRLLLRNALRHKLRSVLTVLGVSIAVMAFALLRTVVTAWHAGVDASAANRLITRHAISFVFPLPLAYKNRIEQVPGVERVT
jgi:putative ABC transport system permease protein